MEYILVGVIGGAVIVFGAVMSFLDMGGKRKQKDLPPEGQEEQNPRNDDPAQNTPAAGNAQAVQTPKAAQKKRRKR